MSAAPSPSAPTDAHLMTRPFFAPRSASESSRVQGSQGKGSAAMSPSRGERLLLDAQRARGLVHRIALIDAEAQHRFAQHRSHFNPDQPRVPAGNLDGGQWKRTGASRIGLQLAGGGRVSVYISYSRSLRVADQSATTSRYPASYSSRVSNSA